MARICASRCGPYLVAAAVGVAMLVVPPAAATALFDLVTLGVLVAVLVLRARVSDEQVRRWLVVAAGGAGLLVAGNAVWDITLHVHGIDPSGGPADLLYTLAYVVITVGLVGLLVDVVGDGWVDLTAEVVVVAAVTGAAMWLFVLGSGVSTVIPPLEDFAALTFIGASAVRAGLGVRLATAVPGARGLVVLAVAWVVWFVGDVAYALMPDYTQFKTGTLADAAFVAGMALVIAGLHHPALVGDVWGRRRVRPRRSERAHRAMVAIVIGLPPLAVFTAGLLDDADRVVVAGAVALVAVATVVRAERARAMELRARQDREVALRATLDRERAVDDELRRVAQMRDLFLRAISHQLRTPLTSIIGFATTLDRQGDGLEPALAAQLRSRILSNARRLELLTDALVDLDLLSRGQMEQRAEEIRVRDLVDGVLEGASTGGRTLVVSVEDVRVTGNPALLGRALGRLLENAVRHTPEGTTITVLATRVLGHVQLSVADNGPGVPPGLHERIFEPLVTGPGAADDPDPGVGLGLALVSHIAELHGGQAWVEDQPRGGACFHLLLPDHPPQWTEPPSGRDVRRRRRAAHDESVAALPR